MSIPLITVILTTYNRSRLLPRAVDSLLHGSYANFELLIMDDASSDGTQEIASKMLDPRIRYIRLPENGGVLRARNRGFDLARGDYITLLDDDDELVPDALAMVAEEFARSAEDGIDVLWFDCRDGESGQASGTMPIPEGAIRFEDFVCGKIQGDFWLAFRRSALHGHRFNESLKAHESLLWLRIHRTHRARYVPRLACDKYREHGGERLCDFDVRVRQLRHTTLALSQFMEEFGETVRRICPKVFGARLAYLGLHQFAIGEFPSGRESVLRSLAYRPSFKYILLYLGSFVMAPRHVVALMRRTDE